MRNLKKFLALVLAMMMTLSLMVTVNAKNVEFDDGENVNEAFIDDLTVLAGMGVIKGMGDGTFKPQTTVTRAEMAAIVYRLRTGDADKDPEYKDKSAMYAGYGDFSDVKADDWFAGYVGFCANAGIIIGYPDGSFGPQNPVTGYEALVMLLRAMGYDQKDEFTGGDWRQHAASIATQRGMLAKVNTTRYRGTLMDGAAREVIAEITFQAATKAQVRWTAAFGYQTSPVSGIISGDSVYKSLGQYYYGLTDHTGVIVGNQETGEKGTLVSTTSHTWDSDKYSMDTSYIYPGTAIAAKHKDANDPDNSTATTAPAGVLVDEQTGLDMYGRKVTVWYNDDDTGAKTTYALLDESSLVKTVYSADDAKLSDGAAADAKLGLAAQAAGFSVDLNKSTTHWSYAYSKFWEGDDNNSQTLGAVGNKSTVKTYTLISNNSDKTVDAVIIQDLEVARIEKKDTTSIPATLNLGKLAADDGYNAPASAFTTTDDDGVLEISKLVKNSVQDVGKVVLATKVVGTVDAAGNTKDWANAGTKDNKLCSYKLEEPLETVSGVISTYKADSHAVTSVTIGGKTYDRSGIAEATKDINWIVKELTDDTNSSVKSKVEAGVRFKLYLDKAGRFIGGVPESDKTFLYGTYADYQLGGLSTGDIEYFITGVNWDGDKVISHKLITVDTANIKDTGEYTGLDVNQKSLAGDIIDTDSKFDTAYMIDEAGNLSTTVEGARQFTGHYWDGATDAAMQWEITAADVARGFKKVTNSGVNPATAATDNTDYLLTSATKFIVVTGTGTSTLDVKIYNGIKELMGSGTNVVISYDKNGATGSKDQVWFQTESDYYNKADTSNNQRIATVILSDKNLINFNASNLYLSDSNAPTGVKLNGPAADVASVEQYVLWNNGVKGTYFIDTSVSTNITDDPAADGVDHSPASPFGTKIQKYGFYTLAPYKEINGVTVYRATETLRNVANNEGGWTGDVYDEVEIDSYNGFANLASAIIGGKEYNITGAKVADVAYENETETNKLLRNPIDSLEKLQKAVSEEHTSLKVCFVYGENDLVTDIYVTTYSK